MIDDIKVSVIVLTYNHEKYIKQALDSILMQQVDFKYEILVGDDASTDGTREILKRYEQKYPEIIKLFLNKENLGASRNSYNMLMFAKGKYLATCEGDDYWTDIDKLKIQVEFLEKNKSFIGCTHKTVVIDEYGNKLCKQKMPWIKQKVVFSIVDFQGYFLPGHINAFVRHNIFLNNKEDYSIIYKAHSMIADRTLMLIFLSYGNIFFINRNMSAYRKHGKEYKSSVTNKIYCLNKNKVLEDFIFTCNLEKYAKESLHLNINFSDRKNTIFADSIIEFIRRPNRENLFNIKRILCNNDNIILCILSLPKNIYKKIIYKLF